MNLCWNASRSTVNFTLWVDRSCDQKLKVAEYECPSEDYHCFLLSVSEGSQDPSSKPSTPCNVHLERDIMSPIDIQDLG